jgi:hypothetical protein
VIDGPLHRLAAKVRDLAEGLNPCGGAPLRMSAVARAGAGA